MTERIHFIGVGGSGMSAVARLTAAGGWTVTGTNLTETAYFAALHEAGMDVRLGHDASLVDGAAAVVVSTAVRDTNVELIRARELGIPVWHRSEALARALEGRQLIGVAGSHGKTTTSAMVAHALHAAGIDASFAVGARVLGVSGAVAGGYAGTAPIAVIEADESDGSFLRYGAQVAVILNIEPDHLDHHGTVENLHRAFDDFAAAAHTVIACIDDPVVEALAARARAAGRRVVTYGVRADADVVVGPASLAWGDLTVDLAVAVPGAHNRLNAAAAWIAAVEVGAQPEAAAASFATFAGTGRRFELRGEVGGIRVIDDYAHHPTEVAAVLAAARDAGAGHLVVVFQPALFSRTQVHAGAFGAALSIPDADVILTPVHGDREDPLPGVSSDLIAQAVRPAPGLTLTRVDTLDQAARCAAEHARPGSTVLTVGSGTVTTVATAIIDLLRDQAAARE